MKCPGQDSRYWKGDAIFEVACPHCKGTIEFFKDDTSRRCPNCGQRVANPEMDFGCAEYCPYAKQCLGSVPGMLGDMEGKQIYRGIMEQLRAELASEPKLLSRAMRSMDVANDVAKRCAGALGPLLTAVSLVVAERLAGEEVRNRLLQRYIDQVPGFQGLVDEVKRLMAAYEEGSLDGDSGIMTDILVLLELTEAVEGGRATRKEALDSAQERLIHQEALGVASKLFQ